MRLTQRQSGLGRHWLHLMPPPYHRRRAYCFGRMAVAVACRARPSMGEHGFLAKVFLGKVVDDPDLCGVQFRSRRAKNVHPRYPAIEPSDYVSWMSLHGFPSTVGVLNGRTSDVKLVEEQFLGKLQQFSPSCSGTQRKRTLNLRECRSERLILAFRVLNDDDMFTLSCASVASDFCKESMTICWSLMVLALNSVARESSVVTVVLIVTRRSIDSSVRANTAWLDNRSSILEFKALRVECTKDTKS